MSSTITTTTTTKLVSARPSNNVTAEIFYITEPSSNDGRAIVDHRTNPNPNPNPNPNVNDDHDPSISIPKPKFNAEYLPHKMVMHDYDGKGARAKLDWEGFELIDWPGEEEDYGMKDQDWEDDEMVKKKVYPEIERLLISHLGASKVEIFSHRSRTSKPEQLQMERERQIEEEEEEKGKHTIMKRENPAFFAHLDLDYESFSKHAESFQADLLSNPPSDVESLKNKLNTDIRAARVLHVWKPIRHPAYDTPLACLNCQTMKKENYISSIGYFDTVTIDTSRIKFDKGHEWWYENKMSPKRVMIFKAYDPMGGVDGVPMSTPHTAFKHPEFFEKDGVKQRQSIEFRVRVVGGREKEWLEWIARKN